MEQQFSWRAKVNDHEYQHAYAIEIMTWMMRILTFVLIMGAYVWVSPLLQSVIFGCILLNLLYASKLAHWYQRVFPSIPVNFLWGT